MSISTTSAAIHITPVVIKTLVKHLKKKCRKVKDGDGSTQATDDFLFDEAFHIVKAFLELSTHNTVESLQSFTNTHIPAPYWAAVCPVQIPLSSCNRAADVLIDWFGPDELKQVVGGERWWQIRGLDGIDAEWITEREFLRDVKSESNEKLSDIPRMEHLDKVMLYVPGGGYYFGSINTHRYQLIHYSRKFHGRVFTVNYRKAPQYPWPCPLQDVLAAYFYLISPPPGATHKPVPPSKIVFAGDSAGGGLCITALTVLRDMNVEQPAGAILISPWVDLTHSFPSVMQNTMTDIIPPHGFVHKPSPLWPIASRQEDGRAQRTRTNLPPDPGYADTLRPSMGRLSEQIEKRLERSNQEGRSVHTGELSETNVGSQADMLRRAPTTNDRTSPPHTSNSAEGDPNYDLAVNYWEPKPPKVLMNNHQETPLELRAQIQLYATNEQLTHPLVSPILQGSLGDLCPLYIIAGDGEVLRDEVIYLAHKAANPQDYPTRQGVLREGKRQGENVAKFRTPTKVHLQVFDGMCHVLTVFTFTESAKYAYKAIAEFIKHVTSVEDSRQDPFPERRSPGGQSSDYVQDPHTGTYMIRERVDVFGCIRAMEPQGDIQALRIPINQIGIIKEEPVRRWLTGQEKWDKKYKTSALKAERRRKYYERKAAALVEHARKQGLTLARDGTPTATRRGSRETVASVAGSSLGDVRQDRRWGPFDLDGEQPPPSAIAGRRDTREAVALYKKIIYHTAPVTHGTVPKIRASDALRAAFNPHDHPTKPPQQTVSEEQNHARIVPFHGVRMWQDLISYFMRRSAKRARYAKDGTKQVAQSLRTKSDGIISGSGSTT
ncbi:alpha/beta-hydrolase [Panus rudis PR-1116 ss-1]|nr:alpha/beta-hydrolase [Panus rudis PR-1116 ss-1]